MTQVAVFKTAKDGYNAKTADTVNLTIDSTRNTLKLFKEYTGTVTTPDPPYQNYVEISHNLGYQPYVELYYDRDNSGIEDKAPRLEYETDPDWYITEEVSIHRPNANQVGLLFLSGDPMGGGSPASFKYLLRIYINAWEGSWYE